MPKAQRWLIGSRGGLLTLGLLLVFILGPELEAGRPSRTAQCFALPHAARLGDGGETGHRARDQVFDVYETSALELDLRCVGATPGSLRVEVLLPNGDTYETLEAVSSPETTGPRGRARRLVPVATVRFPVAGTLITQYGLVGTWSARVCWEEASRPSCGRAVHFSFER